ncbi:MAG: helix-turn-helix domain-containing protein [Terriglobales bacterium]
MTTTASLPPQPALADVIPGLSQVPGATGFRSVVIRIRTDYTPREAEIVNLIVSGCSNKDIAAQLKINVCTVKHHLRTIFLRAGICGQCKRIKLATALLAK